MLYGALLRSNVSSGALRTSEIKSERPAGPCCLKSCRATFCAPSLKYLVKVRMLRRLLASCAKTVEYTIQVHAWAADENMQKLVSFMRLLGSRDSATNSVRKKVVQAHQPQLPF